MNEPKHLINPVRDVILFDSPIIEPFSKSPWYLIPIVYIPIITYYILDSNLDILSTMFYYLSGIVSWSLLEYCIHRFAFHGEDKWLPASNTGYVLHFLIHGIHHAFP